MKSTAIFSLLLSILFAACGKKAAQHPAAPPAEEYEAPIVAAKPVKVLDMGITLPAGTSIRPARDEYSIQVELPEGFSFFYAQKGSSMKTSSMQPLPIGRYATYKCSCSGASNCKVFYQGDAGGFGCMHNTCTGSCTGSFTTTDGKVMGVINTQNNQINAIRAKQYEPAFLSKGGMEQFFSIKEVQEKIAEQYKLLYRNTSLPDFDKLDQHPSLLSNYTYITVQLYGVSFYLLAPAETMQARSTMQVTRASASCACTVTSGSCTKKGFNFLGYKTYWCEGDCNGCALTVND